MASRYYRGGPSRRAPKSGYVSESKGHSIEEEDIANEEQKNRRLRQAIRYLAIQGGSDSLDLYSDRVQQIDDQILQEYAAEEHLFDPKLYLQLRFMVQEVQTDNSPVDDDDLDMLESGDEVADIEQEALLRERQESIDKSDHEALIMSQKMSSLEAGRASSQVRKEIAEAEYAKALAKYKSLTDTAAREKSVANTNAKAREQQLAIDRAGKAAVGQPRRPVQTFSPKPTQPTKQKTVQSDVQRPAPRRAEHPTYNDRSQSLTYRGRSTVNKDQNVPREIVWRYGGPKNDPEQYHQNFPASLPFGETLYMQEWESMKIDFDLKESVNKTGPVTTNVDYDKVKLPTGKNPFDSGSRFKLPEEDPTTVKWLKNDKGGLLWKAVDNFNQGGNLEAAEDKDYAPRIWLPKVIIGKQETSLSAGARSVPPSKVKHRSASGLSKDVPSKATSSATESASPRTAGPSGTKKAPPFNTTSPKSKSSVHDDRAQIYAEIRQAKEREGNADNTRSPTSKTPSRPGRSPTVRVLNPKNLSPQSPLSRTPNIPQSEHDPRQSAVKRGPGRPKKVHTHVPSAKATVSSPSTPVIGTPHTSGAKAASRGTKRKLSVGSKRFVPEKRVSFNEDDNEEFSADESAVNVAKKTTKTVGSEEPKGPSHTRSGKSFLLRPVQ